MTCQQCKSERVGEVFGKCGDLTAFGIGATDVHSINVPYDWGIGGGDYINFHFCLDCGQIQGQFPLSRTCLEENENDPGRLIRDR